MYDGLETATTMFVTYTISRFEEVKQLHVILLVSFCGLLVCYGVLLFRPYVARLLSESKAIAGTTSWLIIMLAVLMMMFAPCLGTRQCCALVISIYQTCLLQASVCWADI